MDENNFRLAFGQRDHEPKYEQFKAVVSTTPSQLSPLQSRKNFARTLTLLQIKGLWFEHSTAAADIFSFQTKNYRGFEYSGLAHDWQDVVLHLFDRNDRHWFAIAIFVDSGARVTLTQAEVNRLIQSFGEAPSTQPNPSLK